MKDRGEPNNRQGQSTRSNAPTARLPILVRLLETLTRDSLNTKRNGDANNHIAVHHQRTNYNIDWDSAQCLTYSTNYFQRLALESWYTNLEQTLLNRCQQLPAFYKRLLTGRLNNTDQKPTNLTNNRRIETHQWLMTNFTRAFQPVPSRPNWPITFNHHRLTNTIHLTLKMTSAQVVETSVTNNSSFQNYPHPDDRTIRTNGQLWNRFLVVKMC